MFLLNSCLSLFSAAGSLRHPFSRSYGVILPSSLTMLLPPALGFSPHPPVSVYGTGTWYTIAAFLGSRNRTLPYLCSVRVTDSDHETDLPVSLLPCLPGALSPGCAVLLRPHSSDTMRYRNLDLLSIGYALKPRLRPRLTPVSYTHRFALCECFPTILREPLSASDTLSEATAPVKLPAWHCPLPGSRAQDVYKRQGHSI